MIYIPHSFTAITILVTSTIASPARESFQEKFAQLSRAEKQATKIEATKKEEYDRMPVAPREMTEQSVVEFCKMLPRGLETVIPGTFAARGETGLERERTLLWARHLSCFDSILYYEGHRFFRSGYYTDRQINLAISEINKVMAWLKKQEEALNEGREGFVNAR